MAQFAAHPPGGEAVPQLEVLVRTALFKPASELIGWLWQQAADRVDAADQPQPGQVRKGRVPLQMQGLFGQFTLQRDYYYHADKTEGHYPADAALGLEGAYTPALGRLICLEGADEASYEKASLHLQETGGIAVSGRQIQRTVQRVGVAAVAWQQRESSPVACDAPVLYVLADGTGVPMRRGELVGRHGQQSDGTAKTRQVYLGGIFTQHKRDDEGHPIRDFESTTYISSFDAVDDFGVWLRRAHLETVLGLRWEKSDPQFRKQRGRWVKLLLKDGVGRIITQARRAAAGGPQAEAMEKALGYFERHRARLQYGRFREAGYFIGSGVIEAGGKAMVGARCQQSGMFWSEPGADHVLALRCLHYSRRLSAFWKDRLNTHSAANDSLPLAA